MFPSSRKGHPIPLGIFAAFTASVLSAAAIVATAQPSPNGVPLGSAVPGFPPVPGDGAGMSFPESLPPPPPPPQPGFIDNPGTSGFEMPGGAGGDYPTFPVVPFEGGGFGVPSGGAVLGKPQVPNVRMAFDQRSGNEGDCPTLLQLVESHAGNVGAGEASVQWITSGGFSLRSRAKDRVAWESFLDVRYNKCDARAFIGDVDGASIARGTGEHLSMDFAKGVVRLTLDLSRAPYFGRIVEAAVDDSGNPQWRYVLNPRTQSRASKWSADDGTALRGHPVGFVSPFAAHLSPLRTR